MKVYYLVVSALCVWTTPTHSQFFYSHYTPFSQFSPFFPQTFLPTLPAAPVAPVASRTASVTYNLPAAPTGEFRGFGYRTDYNDGATSTVFYVTGPEAQQLRNFQDFPNFSRKVEEAPAGKARSLASDIIDINAVPDPSRKIQNVLQPAEFQKLFDTVSVMPGVVNFYSFPAGTVPLSLAQVNTTTNATDSHVAAESVVNSKVIINDVDNLIKSNGTTETTTVSETTEESVTTTEDSETVSVEAKEEKSTSTEETTTENTTEV